ncbi:Cerato-platanin [Amylostereum chailletii]|nr:Cerato-platanin [Amylostereum chailletii]
MVIVGWDSPDCGTCWTLEHDGRTITVLAVDHASDGFNISLDALNDLTNGQGKLLGRVEGVVATQVDRAQCGVNF